METLFSLEVIVNYIKLKKTSEFSCLFPCIAFRLLDYPTIAINLLETHYAEETKQKLNLKQNINKIEKLPCFTDLLDKHGRYVFSKGKSCLFRCEQNSLFNHLKNTPMYLMLLDTYFEPCKLLGTTAVPLINLINDIYSETNELIGHDPCTKMTHGVFEIKNLMGDEIGIISFACRLTSFGSSLLHHIGNSKNIKSKNRIKTKKIISKKKDLSESQFCLENSENEEKFKISEKEITEGLKKTNFYTKERSDNHNSINILELTNDSTKFIEASRIELKDEFVQTNEVCFESNFNKSIEPIKIESKVEPVAKKKTNTTKSKLTKSAKENYIFDDPYIDNFCPPVLFYNSNQTNETNQDSIKLLKKNEATNDRIIYLNNASMEQGKYFFYKLKCIKFIFTTFKMRRT